VTLKDGTDLVARRMTKICRICSYITPSWVGGFALQTQILEERYM